MKKLLLILLLLPVFAEAQFVNTGEPIDSTTFTFSNEDSLIHYVPPFFWSSTISSVIISIDTSSSILWQIGNTVKPVFSIDSVSVHGIMTDTLNPYPSNANDFFILKVGALPNIIISIWHKYQTDSLHAGGIVEFSTDSGSTWMNIADCYTIGTQNFYSSTDTIFSGQPAFIGTSNGEKLSQFQISNCVAFRTTSTTCYPYFGYPDSTIYFRFRFVSDSTIDSLSGWMIDSIKIEDYGCGEGVNNINTNNNLEIYPNPATSQLTINSTNTINQITITNLLGETIYSNQYNAEQVQVDVSGFVAGVYFVKVNGVAVRKFVKE